MQTTPPLTATGTVYGPFDEQPAESAEVPADAPVAASMTVTTTQEGGPTVDYAVDSAEAAKESGFYTIVWVIDSADQSDAVKQKLPADYYFQDRFGLVAESTLVPADITAVSKVTSDTIALSGISRDSYELFVDGIWPKVDGKPIDVVVRRTYYHVPGREELVQQPADEPLPEGTIALGSLTETHNGTGVYTPEEGVENVDAGHGINTWVLEIDPADQPEATRPFVNAWIDDFGIPAETQKILQPTVTTQAQPGAKPGETFTDTAIVEGTLPEGGAGLTFELYEATKNENDEWVCEAGNLLWTSEETWITENGEHVSPEVPGQDGSKVHFVEVLTGKNGGEIHRGECGLENETTYIVDVKTQAKTTDGDQTAKPGEELWDTAVLTGYVPEGGKVSFEVYEGAKGEEAVCSADTLVTTLEATTGPLEGGLYTEDAPLLVESTKFKNEVSKDSMTYFVEVTTDKDGREVSRGECGDPTETVTMKAPVPPTGGDLAFTGASSAPLIYGGIAGAVLLAMGIGALIVIRRRQAHVIE